MSPRKRTQKGALLVVAIIGLFLVTATTMGMLMVTANALHLSGKQRNTSVAFNLAESGAEMAALWLKNQPYPPSQVEPFDPFGGDQPLEDGVFRITITPDPENVYNYLKTYTIVSTGTANGSSKAVQIVVKQASFGRYAYFSDKEASSVSGGAIWWKAGELIDGPVHSNNSNGTNFNINYNSSYSPIFLDMVTGAGSTINYEPSRPQNETTFKRIFQNGSKGYKLGVSTIPLPPSTDAQRDAAWGASSGFPSSDGVYLKADSDGGVYIKGECGMEFSVDASGNQVLEVTQGGWEWQQYWTRRGWRWREVWVGTSTTLTFNKTTQTITATGDVGEGSPSSTSSLGTGVIYCTDDITSLEGEIADNKVDNGLIAVRNAFTIANDVNANKEIRITDDLYYHTQPDKTLSSSSWVNLAAGTLGLVSRDIVIDEDAPANLEIDAVLLAGGQNTSGGSFYVENYSSKYPTGTLSLLGGIIQKSRGPVGTFSSRTGQTVSGYAKNYSYDPRLAVNPPPFYPTTGQYERLSWEVLPDTD